MEIIEILNRYNNICSKSQSILSDHRTLKHVKAGIYYLSIQASKYHYCNPRETMSNFSDYNTMELAIFNNRLQCLDVKKSKFFNEFERRDELLQYADDVDSDSLVFGYVPVDLINDLYLYFNSI